jgi:endo-1,4-beta-D-glucanase Y
VLAIVVCVNHLCAAEIDAVRTLQPTACASWPLWSRYQAVFVQNDGRVIDYKFNDGVSTSEGQAYSLFFALVASDLEAFDRILQWTNVNLAQGDLGHQLPAWHWGKRQDGSWGTLDVTPASDADMWMAYTLIEAGRLWKNSAYDTTGRRLLEQIRQYEVVQLPGFGSMILPAPRWFVLSKQRWRVNPSYLPLQLLRAFAKADPAGPWSALAYSSVSMIHSTAPWGVVPDWALYDAKKGWTTDPDKGSGGSYDAIRVYLWAGMLHPEDSERTVLLKNIRGAAAFLQANNSVLAESLDSTTGQASWLANGLYVKAPIGFSAAMLPYLASIGQQQLHDKELERVTAVLNAWPTRQDGMVHYYDMALSLFGLGWTEERFRFNAAGALVLPPVSSRTPSKC